MGRMYVIGGANSNFEGYNNFEIFQDGDDSYSQGFHANFLKIILSKWALENLT